MIENMELTPLRYFAAVARHGSITAAAHELRVSQPSLTVAIHKLEEELGATLLLRDHRGVRLTSTGDELLHYASEALALLDRAHLRIQNLEHDDEGAFILGCPEAMGAYFLPGFMRPFFAAPQGIQLTLWNGPSRTVEQAVLSREVHFGLVANPLPHPDLVLVELFRDSTRVMSLERPARTLARAEALLREGPLLFVPQLPQSVQIIDRLARKKLVPMRRLSCGDHELVKSLALAGVGAAILPARVAAYGHPGKLRPLHARLPYVDDVIFLAYRSDLHRTRAAVRFKDSLVAHGRAFARNRTST